MARVKIQERLRVKEVEIQELKGRLKMLESRGICKLHIEVEELQSQLEVERIQRSTSAAITTLKLTKSSETVASLTAQLELSKAQMDDLIQQVELSRVENQNLLTGIKDLNSQLEGKRIEKSAADALASSERKTSVEELASLRSLSTQQKDRIAELFEALGKSRKRNEALQAEIEELDREQIFSQNSSKDSAVKFGNIKADNDFLLSRTIELEDALERERKTSSASIVRLRGRLEAAVISRVKLRKSETRLTSQLEESVRKIAELMEVMGGLEAEIGGLVAGKHEMQILAKLREKNMAAVIAVLTRMINFVKNHPLHIFLINLMVSVKGWEGIAVGVVGWLASWLPSLL